MQAPALTLHSAWLRNRVAELGLRQWWLAEQVGVDRKTVMRWVNGQVRSIQPANARVLADVLGCRVDEMLLPEPAAELAGPEDQRAAGLALATSRLLERLGPVGEWDVAERLIRASAVPDLPLHVLGQLYHQLCVACWRQDKLDEAARHNAAALDIALRCGDKALRADALGSHANLCFWRGEVPQALDAWREALALAPWLEAPQRGKLHSNLGASLAEIGDADAGRAELLLALACFDDGGTPMQVSIARGHLAALALADGDLAAAETQIQRCAAQARRGDYRRGMAHATLLGAELSARRGDAAAALAALDEALASYAAQGIDDALNHSVQARVLRLAGQPAQAIDAARAALALAARLPLEQALAWRELAQAQVDVGDATAAQASAQAAAEIYRRCGAPRAAQAALAARHVTACPRPALATATTTR